MNGAWDRKQYLLIEERIRGQEYTVEQLLTPMTWRLNFHVCDSIFEYEQMKRGFTERQCALFAVENAHTKLNGFPMAEFFENEYGILWEDVLAGFKAVGLTELHDIFRSACKKFGKTVPASRSERSALIRGGLDFSELSRAYDDYVTKTPLRIADFNARLLSYAAKYAKDFVFFGDIAVPAY